jgi:hypothetical protein
MTLDEAFTDPTNLSPLVSRSDLRACYDAKLLLQRHRDEDGLCRHVFPVNDGRDVICMLEILRSSPLREERERLVFGLLRVYRNHLGILDHGHCDET